VTGAALLGAGGERLAGALPFDGDTAASLVDGLRAAAERGALALGQPAPRLATLEYEGGVVVVEILALQHQQILPLILLKMVNLVKNKIFVLN